MQKMKRILKVFHFPILCIVSMLICTVTIRNGFGNESWIYLLSLLACGWAIYELLSRMVHFWKLNKEDKE